MAKPQALGLGNLGAHGGAEEAVGHVVTNGIAHALATADGMCPKEGGLGTLSSCHQGLFTITTVDD